METTTKVTPQQFFLNLGMMVALYWTMISVSIVLFDIINTLFPDAVGYGYVPPVSAGAIASVIIVFPLLVVLTMMLNKTIASNPSYSGLWVRKWLIYITIFIAAAAIITDLIVFLTTFLDGGISIRFILKVIAVLIVAAGTLGYLVYLLRRSYASAGKDRIIAVLSSIAMVAVVAAGISVFGSPTERRARELDAVREGDLQALQWGIVSYYESKGALPASLAQVNDPVIGVVVPKDPETGMEYGYSVTSSSTFQLCAEFKTATGKADPSVARFQNEHWSHPAGNFCFDRTVTPKLVNTDKLR